MSEELLARARAWLAEDPDPETRAELDGLIRRGDPEALAELAERFAGRLEFGTAGLRAELGAGPMRMNRVVVAQAAAGLAAYLLAPVPERAAGETKGAPTVVIGYDGRKNSDVFARDTAELMAGAGVRALLLPRMLPTPVLAFAVRHLGADAGVMVTASHNPPRDNGYKVYLGGADAGSQIVPPADAAIEAEIARVAAGSVAALPRSEAYEVLGEEVLDAYVAETAALVADRSPSEGSARDEGRSRIVYTPMHGVGLETFARAAAAAGLPEAIVVAEQAEPDPAFPTVAFPNPEEPGALDLAVALAAREDADLIVANDPDADRLAVAIPDAAAESGWRRLTGNEVGLLLGWAAAKAFAGANPGRESEGVLASSLVSSPGLSAIAAAWGLRHVETLTGFKWISRVPGLVFGYEEALGYLVDPAKVRDKDGISAAIRFVGLVGEWREQGLGVDDCLGRIAERVGGFASGQVAIRVTELAQIQRITARLRAEPPAVIAGRAVTAAEDFLAGVGGFPASDILRYALADGSRVIVRPSGTEPKLKIYLDARSDEGTGAERLAAARAAIRELEDGIAALLG